MALIIDRGGEHDASALKLETRRKRWIRNEVPPERSPVEMQIARRYARTGRPDVIPRSSESRYNCMGMLFASRRTSIDIDQWDLIRRDDEYRQLGADEAPVCGDIAFYRLGNALTHVGMVAEVRLTENGVPSITILSQWGNDGEYEHPADQVPAIYGEVAEFWTHRKLV